MRSLDELKQEAEQAIHSRKQELAAIAESIWKHPETGYRETATHDLGVKTLESLGLPVKKHLALTGFSGRLDTGKPGPGLAILGEMDALLLPQHPQAAANGAVHACGHHTHITSMLGAAMALCDIHAERELSGWISWIGCPAEECIEMEYRRKLIDEGKIHFLGGKQELIRAGALDDASMSIMMHVGHNYNGMDSNGFLKKLVTFKGKSCHAASPQNGVNALNAATLALNAIALMRETFSNDPTIRVHGIMSHGGDAANIIPSEARLEYQIRTNTQDKLKAISARFDQAMKGCAMALGASAQIVTLPGYMPMHNDNALFDVFTDEVRSFRNNQDLQPVIYYDPGCTDMGDVSMLMPAIHPFFPGSAGGAHSIDFHVPDLASTCMEMSIVLARMALSLLYGNAEKAVAIRRQAEDRCISKQEYLSRMKTFLE